MKDKKLLALLILGGMGLYYFMSRPPVYSQEFQYVPTPPPPNNSAAFQAWVDAILKTFGTVAALWAPGGPFYNQPGAPPPPGGTAGPGNPAPGGIYGPGKAAPLLFLLPGV